MTKHGFYAFVRVCYRFRRQFSEVQVSELLRDVGFPRDEADDWGSVFRHCYGVLSTPIPQYAISRERDEILRSLKRSYQGRYVGNSPKLTNSGATKPLLDAYHRTCHEAMLRAGLIENDEKSLRVWEDDLEQRFVAYKAAYEQIHTRPDFPLRVTGRESVGWLFARYLFPGTEPDPRLVLLLNEFGSLALQGLAEMFKSLEEYYRRVARPWWNFWQ